MARRIEEIFVKVVKIGGEVKEYCLNGERTVADALNAAGIDFDEDTKIRVNAEKADSETELEDGDVVTIAGKIEGGTL